MSMLAMGDRVDFSDHFQGLVGDIAQMRRYEHKAFAKTDEEKGKMIHSGKSKQTLAFGSLRGLMDPIQVNYTKTNFDTALLSLEWQSIAYTKLLFLRQARKDCTLRIAHGEFIASRLSGTSFEMDKCLRLGILFLTRPQTSYNISKCDGEEGKKGDLSIMALQATTINC